MKRQTPVFNEVQQDVKEAILHKEKLKISDFYFVKLVSMKCDLKSNSAVGTYKTHGFDI